MTAQQLLDELLELQKQGYHLENLDVIAINLDNAFAGSSFTEFYIDTCEIGPTELRLYNNETQRN